jgi:hypothetical protein
MPVVAEEESSLARLHGGRDIRNAVEREMNPAVRCTA